MRFGFVLLPIVAGAAGCASLGDGGAPGLEAQLARFGLAEEEARCVSTHLGNALSRPQRAQLTVAAAAVSEGYFNRRHLGARDLAYVAGRQGDARIGLAWTRASAACGLGGDAIPTLSVSFVGRPGGSAAGPAATEGPAYTSAPPPAAALAGWVLVGAAATGQAIAVDVGTVEETPAWRQAWFRLIDPGATELGPAAYLLRIDCAARTINPMAQRRHLPDGGIADLRTHGPNGEGALPIEDGTVMEVAYIALCGRR